MSIRECDPRELSCVLSDATDEAYEGLMKRLMKTLSETLSDHPDLFRAFEMLGDSYVHRAVLLDKVTLVRVLTDGLKYEDDAVKRRKLRDQYDRDTRAAQEKFDAEHAARREEYYQKIGY